MSAARASALAMLSCSVALLTFSAGGLFSGCKGTETPANVIEAGAPIAEGVCQLIENQTGSTVLETICATLPEIATIVATILALREDSGVPTAAEVCKPIPQTKVCATPRELHAGIVAVLQERRARFLRDAGMQ